MPDTHLVVAHISDLHPTGILRPSLALLAGKRPLGLLSLLLRRNRRHPRHILDRVIDDVRDDRPDHLLVGGDMVNLALPAEFAVARTLMARTGLPQSAISVVPGNHDRYIGGAYRARLFERYFGVFTSSVAPFPDEAFPFLQVRDGLAVLGVCSGWPASPIQARGTIGERHLRRIEVLLGHPAARGPLAVLVHHPPLPYPNPVEQWLNGLHDHKALLGLLGGTGAVVLHGHRHLALHSIVETARGPVRVIGVPSASDRGGRSERTRGYHRYRFGPAGFEGGERRVWNEVRSAFDVLPLPEPETVRWEDLR
ncbi:MAG: metallophosphoesterase [Myxococcota bacterium]|nr:metallophosphoesterase [Myxococcota bacterium]